MCHSWAGHVYTPRYDKLLTEHILLAGKQQVDRRLHFPDIEAMWQLAIQFVQLVCQKALERGLYSSQQQLCLCVGSFGYNSAFQ